MILANNSMAQSNQIDLNPCLGLVELNQRIINTFTLANHM